MELFRKTLDDVKELIKKGDYQKARKLLYKHISGEHKFNSDVSRLMRAIASYQHNLEYLEINALNCGDRKIKRYFNNIMAAAEGNLADIRFLIKKLADEERAELE